MGKIGGIEIVLQMGVLIATSKGGDVFLFQWPSKISLDPETDFAHEIIKMSVAIWGWATV
jgi:hypothetical protein